MGERTDTTLNNLGESTDFGTDLDREDSLEQDGVLTVVDLSDEDQITVVRAEIEQTRSELGETLAELQDRLSPQTLKEQAKDAITDVASHAKDKVSEVAHQAVDDAVGSAKDAVHGAVDSAKGAMHDAVDSAK